MRALSEPRTIAEGPGCGSYRASRSLEAAIRGKAGDYLANRLLRDHRLPREEMAAPERARAAREFLLAMAETLGEEEAEAAMVEAGRDLDPSRFAWAGKLFAEAGGDIDRFAAALRERRVGEMRACYEAGREFRGMALDAEAMAYVEGEPDLFYGRRHGRRIRAKAPPRDLREYLREGDRLRRRYYACRCPLAKESILLGEDSAPPLMCRCGLGRAMALWEFILGRKLEGRVLRSALAGAEDCVFEIDLPAP